MTLDALKSQLQHYQNENRKLRKLNREYRERIAILMAVIRPFAEAHRKLEMMPAMSRYSFTYSELAQARVAIDGDGVSEAP